jgi:MFS family permease
MTVAAPALEQTPSAAVRGSGYVQAVILIVAGVLATTLAQPQVLARLPLSNLMKNELHLSRSTVSGFFFLCGLPWYFKPLVGIITDAFPVLGSRRRIYIVVSAALAAAGWVAMLLAPHQYQPWFWLCMLINVFMVFTSTVVGGFMVEIAQASASSGRLSSIRNIAQGCVQFVNAPAAGYLASIAFGWTAGICGVVILALVPAAWLLLREERRRVDSQQVLANFGLQFSNIATARTLWAAAALTLLVYIAPGFATALFYRQQNELHMTTVDQGYLGLVASMLAAGAPVAYILACRRYSLRTMLSACIGLHGLTVIAYVFYTSVANAYAISALNAFTGTLGEVALMDLAVRATPRGSESLGFALMVSVRNFALFGTDWLGSLMLDNWKLPFADLVYANAATTLIAAPLVFLLPRALVRRKDAEVLETFPEPATQMQD